MVKSVLTSLSCVLILVTFVLCLIIDLRLTYLQSQLDSSLDAQTKILLKLEQVKSLKPGSPASLYNAKRKIWENPSAQKLRPSMTASLALEKTDLRSNTESNSSSTDFNNQFKTNESWENVISDVATLQNFLHHYHNLTVSNISSFPGELDTMLKDLFTDVAQEIETQFEYFMFFMEHTLFPKVEEKMAVMGGVLFNLSTHVHKAQPDHKYVESALNMSMKQSEHLQERISQLEVMVNKSELQEVELLVDSAMEKMLEMFSSSFSLTTEMIEQLQLRFVRN